MAEVLLEVERLTKVFHVGGEPLRALAGVDLQLRRGECLAIVGESGSGKTTLGNLVLGIDKPTSGLIRFDGEAMPARRSRRLRRRVQVVQQNPLSTLNPKRTVLMSLALPLTVHRLVPRSRLRERVAALLELVGLPPEFMNRYPHALSGGQRQRVALARAIAAEPDCIVLDEPTSSLDVSVQARVLALLVDFQRQFALAYLFITHDLSVVSNIADRVTVLYRGCIVETGPTAALFARPRHRYTQMLLSSIPVVSDEDARLRPTWPDDSEFLTEAAPDRGCPFAPRCCFAIEACHRDAPRLLELAPDHLVACHNPG